MGVASSLVGSCIGLALESYLRYFYRIMLKLMFLLCRLLKKLYLCLRKSINYIVMATTTSIPKQSQMRITPSICCNVNKAREEYANGETISCSTPEDMQRYFDSL